MNTIVVVGASGYIGRYLIAELLRSENIKIKVLSRPLQAAGTRAPFPSKVEVCEGDLCDANSLKGLFEPGCIVLHLAYLWDAGKKQNLLAIDNLLTACQKAGVRRLVHLSTAMVSGRNNKDQISEADVCSPLTEYAITKLSIEERIVEGTVLGFDTVILRPTAVFGPGSENLKKLTSDLLYGNQMRNYLKSCLFDKRRMNLVHVSNVIGAILFLGNHKADFKGQVFIVSDAAATQNNFRDVERILMREMKLKDYGFPRLKIPSFVLGFFLYLIGKDNVNPRSDYISTKLADLGYMPAIDFESALLDYAAYCYATKRL
jgi:nucleoside-diphosphate-sugar epimerase